MCGDSRRSPCLLETGCEGSCNSQGHYDGQTFWHIGPNQDALTEEWLEECKLKFLLFLIVFGYTD
jgi:hypothetical protein